MRSRFEFQTAAVMDPHSREPMAPRFAVVLPQKLRGNGAPRGALFVGAASGERCSASHEAGRSPSGAPRRHFSAWAALHPPPATGRWVSHAPGVPAVVPGGRGPHKPPECGVTSPARRHRTVAYPTACLRKTSPRDHGIVIKSYLGIYVKRRFTSWAVIPEARSAIRDPYAR